MKHSTGHREPTYPEASTSGDSYEDRAGRWESGVIAALCGILIFVIVARLIIDALVSR